MARTLTIYQGEDQTPATDITDMVEWPDCEFGQRAYFGESTGSELRFRDVDGVTGNSQNLPAGLTSLSLAAHNVVRWTEGSNTMFRGRVSPKDYSRGAQVAGRAREVRIALDDYNKDLHNIVIHDYSRPAETDKARVQGILASYLSANPRVTTNLNGSNFISSSNTISLPAHTYTRTNVLEVLSSIAAAANKQWFVTIDGALFYDGNDSTVYASPLRISDRDTEVDNNITWAPIWDVGPSSREDGQQLLSGIWLFYSESQYVHVTNPSVANQYSWWEDIIYDDTVTTATQATVVANAILARRQYEERTYNVSIGPLLRQHWGSLKHGQLIQIKARAIPDADDAYASRRITELRWTPSSDPESLFAHMTLDRPLKANPHGPGQKVDTVLPKPAPQCLPDTGTIGAPVAGPSLFCGVGSPDACGPWSNDVCWSGSSESFTSFGDVAVGHYYSEVQVATKYGGYSPTIFRVQIRDTITSNPNFWVVLGSETLVQCRAGGDWVTLGAAFEVPTGYNQVRFGLVSPGGKAILEASHTLNAYTPPAAEGDDPFCFDYDGQNVPSESPHWLPSDTVEAMVAAAAEPHGFLAQDLTNKSGADRLAGDLVIVDTANDASFTTTTTANLATRDFGILAEDIANNAIGSVLLRGFSANVNLNGATPTRGHYLFSTTTAGRAATSATRAAGAVGQVVGAEPDGPILFWGVPDTAPVVTAGTEGQEFTTRSSAAVWEAKYGAIEVVIDGGGSAITTGEKGHVRIPFALEIARASLLANASGSIVIDIWRDTYANYPPTVADTITASAKPTLSAAVKSEDTTLTGWSKACPEGSVLAFNVDSATTVQRVTLELRYTRS